VVVGVIGGMVVMPILVPVRMVMSMMVPMMMRGAMPCCGPMTFGRALLGLIQRKMPRRDAAREHVGEPRLAGPFRQDGGDIGQDAALQIGAGREHSGNEHVAGDAAYRIEVHMQLSAHHRPGQWFAGQGSSRRPSGPNLIASNAPMTSTPGREAICGSSASEA